MLPFGLLPPCPADPFVARLTAPVPASACTDTCVIACGHTSVRVHWGVTRWLPGAPHGSRRQPVCERDHRRGPHGCAERALCLRGPPRFHDHDPHRARPRPHWQPVSCRGHDIGLVLSVVGQDPATAPPALELHLFATCLWEWGCALSDCGTGAVHVNSSMPFALSSACGVRVSRYWTCYCF